MVCFVWRPQSTLGPHLHTTCPHVRLICRTPLFSDHKSQYTQVHSKRLKSNETRLHINLSFPLTSLHTAKPLTVLSFPLQTEHTFEKRRTEATRIRTKYPDRIPVRVLWSERLFLGLCRPFFSSLCSICLALVMRTVTHCQWNPSLVHLDEKSSTRSMLSPRRYVLFRDCFENGVHTVVLSTE